MVITFGIIVIVVGIPHVSTDKAVPHIVGKHATAKKWHSYDPQTNAKSVMNMVDNFTEMYDFDCPSFFQRFHGRCFRLFFVETTYINAERYCAEIYKLFRCKLIDYDFLMAMNPELACLEMPETDRYCLHVMRPKEHDCKYQVVIPAAKGISSEKFTSSDNCETQRCFFACTCPKISAFPLIKEP